MNLAYWLFQTARNFPEKMAILHGTSPFATYRELAGRAVSLARFLKHEHGISRGDRIAVFACNCPEYLEIMNAAWWLGAIIVPVNYKLHAREAEWIIADSRAKIVFADSELLAGLSDGSAAILEIGSDLYAKAVSEHAIEAPQEVKPDDTAWLFYTSGTTGKPKGVMLTHDNLVHMSLCYGLDVDQVFPSDVKLYAAPMSHGAGLYNMIFTRVGATHLIPQSHGFDPAEIVQLAGEIGNLVFFAAPTMVKRLIAFARRTQQVGSAENAYHGEGIRTVIYGGGPMYAQDIDDALETFGNRFVQIYGQGESPMTITSLSRALVSETVHPRWKERRSSVGTAQACVTVEILDEQMRPVSAGIRGEITVSGPTVMKGYWNNPAATAAALKDGRLLTGDIGYLDEDGFLYLTDRSKDVVISGGTNIYPREVEEVLLRHPAVREAAVIGEPDVEWGEQVVAFLVLENAGQASEQDLEQWCRSLMASFKKPKKYRFVQELPKNAYGKVLKTDLRRLLES